MTTHGPDTGMRSRMAAIRARAAKLELPDYPGVYAKPDTVARLVAAKAALEYGELGTIKLDVGEGLKSYGAGDIDAMLACCGVAFSEHDQVTI